MSLVIYKYPMSQETTYIPMPKGAQILDVQMQHGVPTIWALVHETAELETRNFQTVGTGQSLSDNMKDYSHIGTVQDGSFVWHIFEVPMR